jgi:hypothetical protein
VRVLHGLCGGAHPGVHDVPRPRRGSLWLREVGGDHGGALADLLAVPHADHLLVRAPDALGDVALATLPDNVVDAYRAVGPALAERPGADVLVLAGAVPSIGLYAVALARALGAGCVRYVDPDGSGAPWLSGWEQRRCTRTEAGRGGSTGPRSSSTGPPTPAGSCAPSARPPTSAC